MYTQPKRKKKFWHKIITSYSHKMDPINLLYENTVRNLKPEFIIATNTGHKPTESHVTKCTFIENLLHKIGQHLWFSDLCLTPAHSDRWHVPFVTAPWYYCIILSDRGFFLINALTDFSQNNDWQFNRLLTEHGDAGIMQAVTYSCLHAAPDTGGRNNMSGS